MSTNSTNKIRKAVLGNFTSNIEYRNILVESKNFNDLCYSVSKILDHVNYTIQELTLSIPERQIPFVRGISFKRSSVLNPTDTRIILWGHDTPLVASQYKKTDRTGVSHLVEFQLSAVYNKITFSNSDFDAKLVIDDEYLPAAATDLFLDIAMFNSYSFLRNMTTDEKINFSQQKFEYFITHNLDCFYEYDNTETLLYYSLAFSARTNIRHIDIKKYISLWNDFIKTYYPGKYHIEDSIEAQLKQHKLYGQLSHSAIILEASSLPKGSYLLIRVNKCPKNPNTKNQLLAIFGQKNINHKGWRIIPMDRYPEIESLARTLHISTFKLVKN